jgi:hypothetical protein
VETDERARHPVGQSHFMEEGAKNTEEYIKKEFQNAMKNLADNLVKI